MGSGSSLPGCDPGERPVLLRMPRVFSTLLSDWTAQLLLPSTSGGTGLWPGAEGSDPD